jgi:hypothetical protein
MTKMHEVGTSYLKTYVKNHSLNINLEAIITCCSVSLLSNEETLNIFSIIILFAQVSFCELKNVNTKPAQYDSYTLHTQTNQRESQDTIGAMSRDSSNSSLSHQSKKLKTISKFTCVVEELLYSSIDKDVECAYYMLAVMLTLYPESAGYLSSLTKTIELAFYTFDSIVSELSSVCLVNFNVEKLKVSDLLTQIISKLSNVSTCSFYFLNLLEKLIISDKVNPKQLLSLFYQILALENANEQACHCFSIILQKMKPMSKLQYQLAFNYCWKLKSLNGIVEVFKAFSGNSHLISTNFIQIEKFVFELLNIKFVHNIKQSFGHEVTNHLLQKSLEIKNAITSNTFQLFINIFIAQVSQFLELSGIPLVHRFIHVVKSLRMLQTFAADFSHAITNDSRLIDLLEVYISPLTVHLEEIVDDQIIEFLNGLPSSTMHLFWPLSSIFTNSIVQSVLKHSNLSLLNVSSSIGRTQISRNINILEIFMYGSIVDIKKSSKLEESLRLISKLISPYNPCDTVDGHMKKYIQAAYFHILTSEIPNQLFVLNQYMEMLPKVMDKRITVFNHKHL